MSVKMCKLCPMYLYLYICILCKVLFYVFVYFICRTPFKTEICKESSFSLSALTTRLYDIYSAELQANREHFTIHPVKTVVQSYNTKQEHSVKLYCEMLQAQDLIVHLGINRSSNCIPDIEEQIKLGRRTAYSLMGAGFH